MSKKLEGQVAVVTGASKGIGAAIAEYLAAVGAAVVINYANSKTGADAVVNRIRRADGKAVAVQADVSKPKDIRRLFAETKKAFARLDILVNNAGIYEFAPLEAINAEHFHKHFDLNVLGLLLVTQEAVKHFGPSGGSIINLSSVVATSAPPNTAVYSASKAFVLAFGHSLQKDLAGKGVQIQTVLPAAIATEFWDIAGYAPQKTSNTTMRPEDLVDAALAGFDAGEQVTIPALQDVEAWARWEKERRGFAAKFLNAKPAARYHIA